MAIRNYRFKSTTTSSDPVSEFWWLFALWAFFMIPLVGTAVKMIDLNLHGIFVSGNIKHVHNRRCRNCSNYNYDVHAGGHDFSIDDDDFYRKNAQIQVFYIPGKPDTAVLRDRPYTLFSIMQDGYGWVVVMLNLLLGAVVWSQYKDMRAYLEARKKTGGKS